MDHPPGRRRWRTDSILLGVLALVALLAALALAPTQARTRVGGTTQALSSWLWSIGWVWPVATVLTVAALSQPARRRWPRPARRMLLAIGAFVGLVVFASLLTVSRPRVGVLALAMVLAVGLLAAWVLVVPRRLAPPVPDEVLSHLSDHRDRLEVADARVKLQNDLRTTALQAIAGVAVLAGAVLAFQQLTEDRQQATAARELTLQGQASERFTRAIDQLGSDRREVQLGGIYGLEQIAQQAPDSRLAVIEVLVAYLHRRSPRSANTPHDDDSAPREIRLEAPDVHAALTVLGRRQTEPTDPPLDLRALDLRGADLRGANLRGAELHFAVLFGALLVEADLRGVDAVGADLRGAFLDRADLRDAKLVGAKLRSATFGRTDLRGASLFGADLRGARLRYADLRRADLDRADLRRTNLRGAIADPATKWPQGFDWQGAGVSQ
jgi:Pentapeptide repeats (8 copies)